MKRLKARLRKLCLYCGNEETSDEGHKLTKNIVSVAHILTWK